MDLAYATTGHRAQGLTRGRALVRLTGTEDVNWLYVQLSRARQDTRLYAVVGPEPQGAGELDLPDREQPDGYLQLAQALSRAGGQTLAIDTPSSPDLQRLSTAELRAERDRLRRQLDQAPRDRSRELARATAHRQQAEEALAAHQQPTGRQPPGMLRWLRRGGDQPARMPGGLAVATQQANRAHDRERELRQHQQRRDGWLEANAHLGPQYRQVVRTLAWQRRATGLAVEAGPPRLCPGGARAGAGVDPGPAGLAPGRRRDRAVPAHLPDHRPGPGPRPRAPRPGPAGRPAAGPHGHRAGPGQAARHRPHPRRASRPASAPTSRDLSSSVAGQARSGPPASTTRKEHPDGQFSTLALRRRGPAQRVGAAAQPGRPAGHPRPPQRRPRRAAGRHRRRSAGGGGAGAGQRGPAGRLRPGAGGGGCGRPSGPPGPGPCPGGWPPPSASAPVAGVLGSLLAPRLGLVLGGLAAVAAGWGLRFRPSPDAVAWRRGAAGERRTARLLGPLERHGWAVLHDLAVPGSRANLDHLVIGPGGVFVIDSKQYRGRLQLDPSGRLWHGRYPLAPTLRAVSFEADQAAQVLPDPGVAVVPIVAVHGAQVPWGKVVMDGVPVVSARRLPSMLRQLPAVLGPERVAALADQARVRFHAAA